MKASTRRRVTSAIPAAEIAGFARELAEYRLGGCPDRGADNIRYRIKRACNRANLSFSIAWSLVHKAAYDIIDADPRSELPGGC